jgi:general secretion pathway protein D
LSVSSAPLWAAAVVSVQPSTLTVTTGQTFSLAVDVTGITDLYGYQFDLYFNPAILSAVSVSEGTFLASGGPTIFVPGTIDDVGGTITYNADILESATSGVNGSGTLVNVAFQALTTGSSSVQIENLLALNSFGEGIVASETDSAVLVVSSAAPEPENSLLGAIGFGLLMVWRMVECGVAKKKR